jgi:hypothetical protein
MLGQLKWAKRGFQVEMQILPKLRMQRRSYKKDSNEFANPERNLSGNETVQTFLRGFIPASRKGARELRFYEIRLITWYKTSSLSKCFFHIEC